MATTFLRLKPVLVRRGRSRASHYADIKAGLFVPPVRIGAQSVAWPEHEVEALNKARLAGCSDLELRSLVSRLLELRAMDQRSQDDVASTPAE